MNKQTSKKPGVLIISAHDPSGGAGIQADIESVAANNCNPASLITATTAQNTKSFRQLIPQQAENFQNQFDTLIEDIRFASCKVGLTGSTDLVDIIAVSLRRLAIPVVLDPVLAAGSGSRIVDEALRNHVIDRLFPLVTVLTPNSVEACELTDSVSEDIAGEKLLEYGCKNVLITGADNETNQVINKLYRRNESPVVFKWERLPGTYHGSGCTLSAALASLLARNVDILNAVRKAQEYTWHTLKNAQQLGRAQKHPDRFYFSKDRNE